METTMARLRVNKIDAARRQIDCAIRLLFSNEDPVAIHTLAFAAFQIVHDVSAKKNTGKTREALRAIMRPGKEKDVWKALKDPANFFKHADRDAERILERFPEEVNEVILACACSYYHDLGYSLSDEMHALQQWLMLSRPEGIPADLPYGAIYSEEVIMAFREMNRAEQLAFGKKILNQFYRTKSRT